MKKFFAVVVCCALIATNVSAQEGTSVVENTSSDVVLASGQEPAVEAQNSATDVAVVEAPVTHVSQEPAAAPVVEGAATPVEGVAIEAPMYSEASPVVANNGCGGCGGGVVTNYAVPMASSYAAPMATGCCPAPAPVCCPSNGGFSRPQIIRGFSSRMTSYAPAGRMRGLFSRGNNNCCY